MLVKEILEDYDFHVDQSEDTVLARIDGEGIGYIKDRLKILGYLLIHTRQLDMVMSRPGAVKYYRDKIHAEIRKILSVV